MYLELCVCWWLLVNVSLVILHVWNAMFVVICMCCSVELILTGMFFSDMCLSFGKCWCFFFLKRRAFFLKKENIVTLYMFLCLVLTWSASKLSNLHNPYFWEKKNPKETSLIFCNTGWIHLITWYSKFCSFSGSNSDLHKMELPGTNVHAYEK